MAMSDTKDARTAQEFIEEQAKKAKAQFDLRSFMMQEMGGWLWAAEAHGPNAVLSHFLKVWVRE
jgi:hypothetical protein